MFENQSGVEPAADTTDSEPVDFQFRKERRLQSTADFSLVFAGRRSLRGELFDLHYRLISPGTISESVGARLGVVIPKKLAHRAVQRNLLKRLAREAFRLAWRELPPFDMVLRLAKAPGDCVDVAARKAWRADIEKLLVQLQQ